MDRSCDKQSYATRKRKKTVIILITCPTPQNPCQKKTEGSWRIQKQQKESLQKEIESIKLAEGENYDAKVNVANAYLRDNAKELYDYLIANGGENSPLYPKLLKFAMSLSKNNAGMHTQGGATAKETINISDIENKMSEAAKKGDFKAVMELSRQKVEALKGQNQK